MVLVGVTTVVEAGILVFRAVMEGGFGWMMGGVVRGWVRGVASGRWSRLVKVGEPAPVMDSMRGEKQELSSPGPSNVRGLPLFLFISPILSSPFGDMMFGIPSMLVPGCLSTTGDFACC